MKILVYYKASKKINNFEGARLRKTIKGALEMVGVEHTSNPIDSYSVVHLIAPEDEKIIDEAREYNVPIVVSALYTEDDPSASYLDEKVVDGKKLISLKPKAIKFLNKADLILVPVEENVNFLKKAGINTPIKVCKVGVNLSRFDFSRDDEKDIFYRYFREDKNKKLVIAVGEYDSEMSGINAFLTAAKKCPDAAFYFIGRAEKSLTFKSAIKKITKHTPNNVHYVKEIPDDVYRSALLNADVFMVPGYKTTGVINIYEAMAAKAQIIARKSSCFKGLIKEGETAHVGEFSETLSCLTKDCLENKIKPTIQKAYDEVSQNTLTSFGSELTKIYQEIIK